MKFEEFKEKFEKVKVEEYPNNVPEKPIVSVCVVTFQHVNFIRQCLDGILMQKTNFNFEILIGEDASTDGTREICIEYAKKFPNKIRLFLHHRENNIIIGGGATGRFNLIYNLFSAQGKYIAICEGDDYWVDSKKLQKQVCFLEKNKKYSFCFHWVNKVNESGNLVKKNVSPANFYNGEVDFSSERILAGPMLINTCSLVYRNLDFVLKGLLEGLDLHFADKTIEKLLSIKGSGWLFKESMANYRINKKSLTHTSQWKELDHLETDIANNPFYESLINMVENKRYVKILKYVVKANKRSTPGTRGLSLESIILVYYYSDKSIIKFSYYFMRLVFGFIKRKINDYHN